MHNYKASHLSDILSDIESNISPQNRCRAINFTWPNSMNIPLSKELGLFTIAAIPATQFAIFLPSFFSSPVIFSIFGFGTRSAELRDLIAPAIH